MGREILAELSVIAPIVAIVGMMIAKASRRNPTISPLVAVVVVLVFVDVCLYLASKPVKAKEKPIPFETSYFFTQAEKDRIILMKKNTHGVGR